VPAWKRDAVSHGISKHSKALYVIRSQYSKLNYSSIVSYSTTEKDDMWPRRQVGSATVTEQETENGMKYMESARLRNWCVKQMDQDRQLMIMWLTSGWPQSDVFCTVDIRCLCDFTRSTEHHRHNLSHLKSHEMNTRVNAHVSVPHLCFRPLKDRHYATAITEVMHNIIREKTPRQADIRFQRFKRLLKTFLFRCWDRGALWLAVKAAPHEFTY